MLSTKRFHAAKYILQAATKKQIELTQIDALITIYHAGEKGVTITDISKATGVSISAAGRSVATLSAAGFKGSKMKGWGLVEAFLDYERPQFRVVRCTAKGRRVVEDVLLALCGNWGREKGD